MEIIRLNRSANVLSGNPIPVAYYISPWNEGLRNSNIYIMLTVGAELAPGSNAFSDIYSQKLMPGHDGGLEIDLRSIVHSALNYRIPDVQIKEMSRADGQLKRFRLTAVLFQNEVPVISDTGYITAMKAGAGMVHFNSEYFSLNSENTWFAEKKPLAFTLDPEKVAMEDIFFLYYLKPENETLVRAKFRLYYTWGGKYATVDGFLSDNFVAGSNNEIFCVPAGYLQAGIDSSLPEDAIPIAYEISVTGNNDSVILNPVKFTLNQAPHYNAIQLLYRNSLGGLQPLRLYGQTEVLGEYEGNTAQRIAPPSYIADNAVQDVLRQSDMQETPGFKGNTGWLTRQEAERLRDFLLSAQRFEVAPSNFPGVGGQNLNHAGHKLVPIKLNTSKVTFYSNEDGLISVGLEWSHAVINRFYTPQGSGGSGASQPPVCPDVKTFVVRQNSVKQLKVIWAFPFGYNHGEVSVTFPGEATQIFQVEGNSGSEILNIAIPAAPPESVEIDVECRVICNPNSSPVAGGTPYATTLDWEDSSPIVATQDMFVVDFDSLPFPLPVSVLENDYDPEGGTLHVLGGPLVYTIDAANYAMASISVEGIITITDWEGIGESPEGALFEYKVARAGTYRWIKVPVKIIKKSGGEAFIYVKMMTRNQRTEGTTTYADIFVETYKDAACTQPMTVSELTVAYSKKVRTWVTGYSNTEDVTNGTVTLRNNSSAKIYTGAISYYTRGGGNTTTFEVTPSADYVKV